MMCIFVWVIFSLGNSYCMASSCCGTETRCFNQAALELQNLVPRITSKP